MRVRFLCSLVAIVCLCATANANSGNFANSFNEKKPAAKKKVSATHPFYRSALANLRSARWMIVHHPKNWQPQVSEKVAIGRIDAAISEIVKASINDGQGPNDRPSGVKKKFMASRLDQALACLRRARVNISRDGDKNLAQGLQLRAYEQIDGAISAVKQTLKG